MNNRVLMSGSDFFSAVGNNSYSHIKAQPDHDRALSDFQNIRSSVESIGIEVIKVDAPASCPDGVYTANWALCRGNKAVLSFLPNTRRAEMPYAEEVLTGLGKETVKVPQGLHFSGQGDAIPCGNYLLAGSGYRTDAAAHKFLADSLGYQVITLKAVPDVDVSGRPLINKVTGWPDSFFYDIDLAICTLRPDLIAWCPEAFEPESQDAISGLPMQKIEVSLSEAKDGFACNLISNGQSVVMSAQAPELKANIEAHGLQVISPDVSELGKGGGFIRCVTLTLD